MPTSKLSRRTLLQGAIAGASTLALPSFVQAQAGSAHVVVVGGTKVLWGPALGAAVYFLAKDVLGDHAQHWMAIFGVALIIVIVFAPEGLSGLMQRLIKKRRPKPSALVSGIYGGRRTRASH